jgi:hypothetical protein
MIICGFMPLCKPNSSRWHGKATGVPAETLEAVPAPRQLPRLLRHDDVELGGERVEIGRGQREEGAERVTVGVEEKIVGVRVGLGRSRVENGLGKNGDSYR